jgi:glycosyltransferase involved in cell wall biosynthesis
VARKLKRLLLTADPIGGVWTYCVEILRNLSPQIEIALATMGAPLSLDQRCEISHLKNVHLFENTFKLEWMNDPWTDLQLASDWLMNLEIDFKPDVVHLNQYAFGYLPWSAPVLTVAHSCVLSWWKGVYGQPPPAEWNMYRDLVQNGLIHSDAVVAPSTAMATMLQENYSFTAPVYIIYNGLDPQRFVRGPKRQMILSVGRVWDPAKNISSLVDVAGELPWLVAVAGENSPGEQVIGKNVHYKGKIGSFHLRSLFGSASIYALPVRYEPFGLSVLEAALSGCALVLGNVNSLQELWNGAAVFVNPSRKEELVDAITFLIKHPLMTKEYSRLALKRASRYGSRKMIRNYLRLYDAMMQNKKHKSKVRPKVIQHTFGQPDHISGTL